MKLLFSESEIRYYASRYPRENDAAIESLVPEVQSLGYLRRSDLLALSFWLVKGRNNHRVLSNASDFVVKATSLSFRSKTERSPIQHLVELQGVGLPMGSAILHWFHRESYPMWNRHARNSVLFEDHAHLREIERWEALVVFCRDVASRSAVDMRTLDRAFWGFQFAM